MIPTLNMARSSAVSKMLLENNHPVLVTGQADSGKTYLLRHLLLNAGADCSALSMHYSPNTLAHQVLEKIEQRLEKMAGRVYKPAGTKKLYVAIDDFNMPKK